MFIFMLYSQCKRIRTEWLIPITVTVQRIPRYELLLREMIKYTDDTHVDYADLNVRNPFSSSRGL
jgi:hypothetical protein